MTDPGPDTGNTPDDELSEPLTDDELAAILAELNDVDTDTLEDLPEDGAE